MSVLLRRETLPHLTIGALRLVAGLMFMQHGVQKHLGWLLPPDRPFMGSPETFSQMWFAGTLEIVGGFLVAIGLFTRPVAFLLSGMMATAYFIAHMPQGFWPILNGGELAVLYCFIFLALSTLGGGRFSVDAMLRKTDEVIPAPLPKRVEPAQPYEEPWPADKERRGGERARQV
jgi:putative oxidoreductase